MGTLLVDRDIDTLDESLPLEVVPNWDQQVQIASELCRMIDRHVHYEAKGRLVLNLLDFRPEHLCREQRVSMITDLIPTIQKSSAL